MSHEVRRLQPFPRSHRIRLRLTEIIANNPTRTTGADAGFAVLCKRP